MKNNQGTLQGSVVCAYSEPGRCLLTVSAAPVIKGSRQSGYIKFSTAIVINTPVFLSRGGNSLW